MAMSANPGPSSPRMARENTGTCCFCKIVPNQILEQISCIFCMQEPKSAVPTIWALEAKNAALSLKNICFMACFSRDSALQTDYAEGFPCKSSAPQDLSPQSPAPMFKHLLHFLHSGPEFGTQQSCVFDLPSAFCC